MDVSNHFSHKQRVSLGQNHVDWTSDIILFIPSYIFSIPLLIGVYESVGSATVLASSVHTHSIS